MAQASRTSFNSLNVFKKLWYYAANVHSVRNFISLTQTMVTSKLEIHTQAYLERPICFFHGSERHRMSAKENKTLQLYALAEWYTVLLLSDCYALQTVYVGLKIKLQQ